MRRCAVFWFMRYPNLLNFSHFRHLLAVCQVGMRFLTERGQNVNGQPNIIYVSTDNGATWFPLHEFVDVRSIYPLICSFCCRYLSARREEFNERIQKFLIRDESDDQESQGCLSLKGVQGVSLPRKCQNCLIQIVAFVAISSY